MLPLKKILCPTDFSEPSFQALKTAGELAEQYAAQLYVLHVVDPIPAVTASSGAVPPTSGPTESTTAGASTQMTGPTTSEEFNISLYQEELEKRAEKMLQETIDRYVPEGVKVNPMVVHGEAAKQIIEEAETMDTDLIVIATHGASGWQHMICGAVLEKVVRRAKRNVLTVYSEPKKK
jgi:nucleotide-binding universal stress UspA family protein